MRKLFPSARGLENTWHSIVKIQQSLYREVRRCLLLPWPLFARFLLRPFHKAPSKIVSRLSA